MVKVRGTFENLTVTVGLDYLIAGGSPGAFLNGVNLYSGGPDQMAAFTERVAADFGVPSGAVRDAETTRLDIVLNLIVTAPVVHYFDVFGSAPYLRRHASYGTTLYYRQKSEGRLVRIYDKMREIQQKGLGGRIPQDLRSENVLRIEFQTKSARRSLQRGVTLGMLADPEFWPELIGLWAKNVNSIRRASDFSLLMGAGDAPTTAAECKNRLAAIGLEVTGGADGEIARIEANYHAGLIRNHQRRD